MRTDFLIILASGAVSAALCAAVIPLLRKIKAGQYILGYVKEHESKGGTPTMGGVAFMLAIALVSIFFGIYADKRAAVCITLALAYMVVGFLDDFIKVRFKRNLGLKAYQKIVFQHRHRTDRGDFSAISINIRRQIFRLRIFPAGSGRFSSYPSPRSYSSRRSTASI